jgi:hypothetical protein
MMDKEVNIARAIASLDTSLFRYIESQTTDDDKYSLLAVQRAVRQKAEYVYLEIGSHLGGTLQPHLLDPRCTTIYSIDPRPLIVDDERGEKQKYFDNSTERMMRLLSAVAPDQVQKIRTIDKAAPEIDPQTIDPRADLCFIDGEHTNTAAIADFEFCIKVLAPDGAIIFHDSDLVYKGIRQLLARLRKSDTKHFPLKLGGSVFAIAFGGSPLASATYIRSISKSIHYHFLRSAVRLRLNRHKIKRKLKKRSS